MRKAKNRDHSEEIKKIDAENEKEKTAQAYAVSFLNYRHSFVKY